MRLCGRRACECGRQVSVCVYQSRLDMAASNTKPQGLPLKQNSVHTAPYPAPPLVLEASVDGCCDSSPLPTRSQHQASAGLSSQTGASGAWHRPPVQPSALSARPLEPQHC